MAAVGPALRPAAAPAPVEPIRGTPIAVRGHAGARRHAKVRPQPRGRHHRLRATSSLYERTTSTAVLRRQGCRAGGNRTTGLVILDFGKLTYRHGTYGTLHFGGRFASNRAITWAMKAYAAGYSRCLPRWAHARISLARGTSNYWPTVPSTYRAGRQWAAETLVLARFLRNHGFDDHVTAAAADDVEPAWDRTFHKTRRFFQGYRAAKTGYLLYNYGSLDGGVGGIWNV